MDTWLIVVIVVVVLLLIAAAALAAMRRKRQEQRSAQLRDRFGPEYDRTLERGDGRKSAEEDLERRAEQHDRLQLRPLAPAARERFTGRWNDAQNRFVDDPELAIGEADTLVREVMRERGYPVDDFERREEDLSVDHPHLVENFRGASSIAQRSRRERVSTEDQRQAMVHFRSLFDELLVTDDAAGQTSDRAREPEPSQTYDRAREPEPVARDDVRDDSRGGAVRREDSMREDSMRERPE
jgi:hypothetical protein